MHKDVVLLQVQILLSCKSWISQMYCRATSPLGALCQLCLLGRPLVGGPGDVSCVEVRQSSLLSLLSVEQLLHCQTVLEAICRASSPHAGLRGSDGFIKIQLDFMSTKYSGKACGGSTGLVCRSIAMPGILQ